MILDVIDFKGFFLSTEDQRLSTTFQVTFSYPLLIVFPVFIIIIITIIIIVIIVVVIISTIETIRCKIWVTSN